MWVGAESRNRNLNGLAETRSGKHRSGSTALYVTSTVVLNKFTYSKLTPLLVFVGFTSCYYHLYSPNSLSIITNYELFCSKSGHLNHSSAIGTVRENLAEYTLIDFLTVRVIDWFRRARCCRCSGSPTTPTPSSPSRENLVEC